MKRQRGLSLIELMIAILISSLLLLGVVQLFSNTSATDRSNTALARVQESGRVALEIIGADARRAGYQGCSSASNTITVGSLVFPAAALAAADRSVSFRYATLVNTSTLFGTNKNCAGATLYLNNVTYSRCPSGGVQRICRQLNGGTADPILDNADITTIQFGTQSGGKTAWKDSASVTTAELQTAHSVRIKLTIAEGAAGNQISRTFTGTYELRNRL